MSYISLGKIFVLYLMLVQLGFIRTCLIFKLHLVCDVCNFVNQFWFEKLIWPNGIFKDSHGSEYQIYWFSMENPTVP